MDNNYNDFNNQNRDNIPTGAPDNEASVQNTAPADPTPAQANTTAQDPQKTQPQSDAETAPAADPAGNASQTQSGSYTYHGSYGQNPYGSQTQQTNYGAQNQQTPYGSQNQQNPYGAQNQQYRQNPYGTQPSYNGQNPVNRQTAYGNQGWSQYQTSPAVQQKSRSGVSVAALAITLVVAVLLSAAAGLGGAYLYNSYYTDGNVVSDGGSSDGGNSSNSDGSAVIHRVVESDESTSTGVKGVYTDVAAIVKDSVVEITTEFKVTGFFQYVSEGAGSGVIISEDGYIITNNHVISDSDSGSVADTITVRLTDGTEYKATLVGKDADSDVAVIKIEPDKALTFAVFGDSDKLTVGEEVLAVGNPLGELGGTVTNGIISALDREISVDGTTMNLLQTNAAINPGNSGGGLFNMKGELIGVVNAKSSGSGIEGLGFAIPSNDALEVAEQLMENGYVTGKTYLGVSFVDVTDAYTAYSYFRSQATGVYVYKVEQGYNDDVLESGDRIVAVDGNEITEFAQIKDILKEREVGDILNFTLYRKGKLTEVQVTCFEYVPEDAQNAVDFNDRQG